MDLLRSINTALNAIKKYFRPSKISTIIAKTADGKSIMFAFHPSDKGSLLWFKPEGGEWTLCRYKSITASIEVAEAFDLDEALVYLR